MLEIVLKLINMKAIELVYNGDSYLSSDIIMSEEKLYTRSGKPIKVIWCSSDNECTSLDPMPAYRCRVEGLKESGMVYDEEMLEYLNR